MSPLASGWPADLIEEAMHVWSVPGLALAIVQGDQLALTRAFGARALGAPANVTTNTQFMVCSLTKSITAAGIALLVDEKRLQWDTRAREVLPAFQLRDPYASATLTVADLLTHQSGLPAHDRIWSPPEPRSRQDMLDAMAFLEPSAKLRERHQYSNLGYVVAGAVIERLTGQRWEDFTAQRLLLPVGFEQFGFVTAALRLADDHALPHGFDHRGVYREVLWPMHATPAEGMHASVIDMTRWLRFLLAKGCVGALQLISRGSIESMMTPRVSVAQSEFSEIGMIRYGFGLRCEHYRGDVIVSHTGSLSGWASLIALMPDHGIGVVVLTNRDPCPVRELIAYSVFDALRQREPVDWIGRFKQRRLTTLKNDAAQMQMHHCDPAALSAGMQTELFGDYVHPAYGKLSIYRKRSVVSV